MKAEEEHFIATALFKPTSDGGHIYEWLDQTLILHPPLHHTCPVLLASWSELSCAGKEIPAPSRYLVNHLND